MPRALISSADFDGCLTPVGAGWEHTLGYSQCEALGRPFIDFTPRRRCAALVVDRVDHALAQLFRPGSRVAIAAYTAQRLAQRGVPGGLVVQHAIEEAA